MNVSLDDYEYEKYACKNVNEIPTMLEKYGVAILPSVLNEEECSNMKSGMWDYLETVTKNFDTPMDRDNSDTWKEIKKLWIKHSMLIQNWSIGHAQFIWDLRQNQKIIDVFSTIWNTPAEDLLVSFDGASVNFPPETTKFGWAKKDKTWLHSDQCFLRNGFECIQSWVTAYDVNPGDATLTFLEGSHKYHKDFKTYKDQTMKEGSDELFKKAGDWYKLDSPDELDFYINKNQCSQKCIICPAGSICLWDSRTIHCGLEALKEREEPNTRCVAYLCYTPRSLASETVLAKKIKAFKNLRTTNHWAHKPLLFSTMPRTYGAPIAPIASIDAPTGITDLGKRLIGF